MWLIISTVDVSHFLSFFFLKENTSGVFNFWIILCVWVLYICLYITFTVHVPNAREGAGSLEAGVTKGCQLSHDCENFDSCLLEEPVFLTTTRSFFQIPNSLAPLLLLLPLSISPFFPPPLMSFCYCHCCFGLIFLFVCFAVAILCYECIKYLKIRSHKQIKKQTQAV